MVESRVLDTAVYPVDTAGGVGGEQEGYSMNWNSLKLPAKPYYSSDAVINYCGDARKMLPKLPDNSIDLVATDPPYGIGFMGKDWDKALPDKQIWLECYRVLKDGAFAFVMSIPRADCLSRMIISLEDAGFWVNFTPIFWAYASGFPKAQNIGKAADKRLGAKREVVGKRTSAYGTEPAGNDIKSRPDGKGGVGLWQGGEPKEVALTGEAITPQAKALDGSFGGFQPKPAVEVVIVAMKPLSEKTFVDQALKNRKGITWLDEGRIPYESEGDKEEHLKAWDSLRGNQDDNLYELGLAKQYSKGQEQFKPQSGRFPANLLVSDDVLNDGKVRQSGKDCIRRQEGTFLEHYYGDKDVEQTTYGDAGSFSRYFDLDKWFEERIRKLPASVQKTFPFLIVPKASKGEKNKGLDGAKGKPPVLGFRPTLESNPENWENLIQDTPYGGANRAGNQRNDHPTVKPLKLMSYLITLGSRSGDIVLDPFVGSGTTNLACQIFGRKCIGIEIEEKYCEIVANRCRQSVMELNI